MICSDLSWQIFLGSLPSPAWHPLTGSLGDSHSSWDWWGGTDPALPSSRFLLRLPKRQDKHGQGAEDILLGTGDFFRSLMRNYIFPFFSQTRNIKGKKIVPTLYQMPPSLPRNLKWFSRSSPPSCQISFLLGKYLLQAQDRLLPEFFPPHPSTLHVHNKAVIHGLSTGWDGNSWSWRWDSDRLGNVAA